jgi:hypothetical protein
MPLNLGARNTCCRPTVESVFDQRRTLQKDREFIIFVCGSCYACQSQYGAAAQQLLHVQVLQQHPFWSASSNAILNFSQD